MMVWSRVVCFLVLAALNFQVFRDVVPSVLWCWRQKGIRPVKNWVVGCWHGYLSGARCRLHMAQLMPLPLTVSCSSKIQMFYLSGTGSPGSPRQRVIKCVCACACVLFMVLTCISFCSVCFICFAMIFQLSEFGTVYKYKYKSLQGEKSLPRFRSELG